MTPPMSVADTLVLRHQSCRISVGDQRPVAAQGEGQHSFHESVAGEREPLASVPTGANTASASSAPDRIAVDDAKPPPALTAVTFCAWLSQAGPGETLVYHRGLLAHDRAPLPGRPITPTIARVDQLAECAWCAAQAGLVHLIQRRLGREGFAYTAIARPRRGAACLPLDTLLSEETAP